MVKIKLKNIHKLKHIYTRKVFFFLLTTDPIVQKQSYYALFLVENVVQTFQLQEQRGYETSGGHGQGYTNQNQQPSQGTEKEPLTKIYIYCFFFYFLFVFIYVLLLLLHNSCNILFNEKAMKVAERNRKEIFSRFLSQFMLYVL